MAASDRYVVLGGGLSLPIEPLLLALELEDRGFRLRCEGDSLFVQPADQLTAADRQRIRRWKRHLMAVVSYEVPTQ